MKFHLKKLKNGMVDNTCTYCSLYIWYSKDLEPDIENKIIQFKTISKLFSEDKKLSIHTSLETLTR